MENMENKENKVKAVKLSDDELENASGGALALLLPEELCSVCGKGFDLSTEGCRVGKEFYCGDCQKKLGF